jgi:hypothetical protein
MEVQRSGAATPAATGSFQATTLGTHPGGFSIVRAIGEDYTPYGPGISGWQLDLNHENHTQFNFPMLAVARQFVSTLDGPQGRND